MIHSIYTHKEIFLRELISNASDAMDKLYYRSLKEHLQDVDREDFAIDIAVDKEHRTLTIWDTGIGMTEEELENNLGVIAKSGSFAFKNEQEEKTDDVDIIGQFGVGFYSAFMVSDLVTVVTRAYGSDQAYRWESKGVEGYTVDRAKKTASAPRSFLHIKENTEDENYDEFLDSYRLQGLIKKYSDYIRYPHPHGCGIPPSGRGQRGRIRNRHRDQNHQQHGADLAQKQKRDPAGGIQRLLQG